MTPAQIVLLILKVSIALLVFAVGLGTKPRELIHLLGKPGQLLRSLISMNLVMLIVAVGLALLFPLHRSVKIMLVALALSPVPPILPKKLIKAGGGHDYVMALLFSASVFAIAWIPLAGLALNGAFAAEIRIPPIPVAAVVSMTVLGPTLAGVVVGLLAPGLAPRLASLIGRLGTVLLLAATVLILVKVGPIMLALIGDGTLLAIAAFVLLGLAVGHLLGGPTPGDRSVLALATASRHPAVAIAIAHITFPAEKAVPAAVLLYLLASLVLTLPYVAWRKRVIDQAADGTDQAQAPRGQSGGDLGAGP